MRVTASNVTKYLFGFSTLLAYHDTWGQSYIIHFTHREKCKVQSKGGNSSIVIFCIRAFAESVISLLNYLDQLFLKISLH